MADMTSSGHHVGVVMHSQRLVRVVREFDPKLDDPEFVRSLNGSDEAPSKPKLK